MSAENEQWAQRLGPRHTFSNSGQGLSDHHYRLHSVRLRVDLQSFTILCGNQRKLALTFSRGKNSPNINILPNFKLYFHWHRRKIAVVLATSFKSLVVALTMWSRVRVEVIITTETRISFHFSFHFSLFWHFYETDGCWRQKESCENSSRREQTKTSLKVVQHNDGHQALQGRQWWWWWSSPHLPCCLSSELSWSRAVHTEVIFCSLHNDTGEQEVWQVFFCSYCRLQPDNETFSRRIQTQSTCGCARSGCLHSNFTMWFLAVVLLGCLHAS